MRELKFRAYHKNEKKMYNVFSFCYGFIKVIIGVGTASEKIPINLFEPIMQYTGQKDKKGNDIYEGDILEDEFGSKGVVIWNNDDASFSIEYDEIDTQSFLNVDEWSEVVGNIYE